MELVTLSNLKSFLIVEHDDDDTLIETLGDSAESYVKNHLSITGSVHFSSSLDTDGMNAARIATYQIVSHWYENRDIAMSGGDLSHAGIKLINPLRHTL